jgi:hypothetical protein
VKHKFTFYAYESDISEVCGEVGRLWSILSCQTRNSHRRLTQVI